jgi:hypothetical protein
VHDDLRRGEVRGTRELEAAIRSYPDRSYPELNNRRPEPFIWSKTADQILHSVARFCKRISDSAD